MKNNSNNFTKAALNKLNCCQFRDSSTYTKSLVLNSLNLCQMSGAHTEKKLKDLEKIIGDNN